MARKRETIEGRSRRAVKSSGGQHHRWKKRAKETDLVVVAHDRPLQLRGVHPSHEVFHVSDNRRQMHCLTLGIFESGKREDIPCYEVGWISDHIWTDAYVTLFDELDRLQD